MAAIKKHYIFGEGGVQKKAKELDVNYLGDIPLEMGLRKGSDNGFPFMANKDFKKTVTWRSYEDIAKKVAKKL